MVEPMGKGALLQECERIIKTFNPKKMTLDSHALDQLGDCDSPSAPADHVFIKQVFYGVVRHKAALKAFLTQFYSDLAASVLRADYTMYTILAYLALFRLEELTFPEFTHFMESQEPDKMSNFLKYIFDTQHLSATVKWEWMKVYDLEFVENSMLKPLLENQTFAKRLSESVLSNTSALPPPTREEIPPKHILRTTTVPHSPRITKPAPRKVPVPERIPQTILRGKDPTYMEKTSLQEIEDKKRGRLDETRQNVKQKYPAERGPKLHETRATLEKSMKVREAEIEDSLQFTTKRKSKLPPARSDAPIRMNAAAILREDSVYKRKQQQEVDLIQSYEAELRDATEFYQWQAEMKERDIQARLDQVDRVRMLAKLSAQEARDAMDRQREDNREMAAHVKLESEEMQRLRELESEMELVMNRKLVDEVIQVRTHAPREAEARVFKTKKERTEMLKADLAERLREKEEAEKIEQAEREDRVRQLRALAEVHQEYVNVFDPTESAGVGLLDEMSLVEMKERLQINKLREEEDRERKRTEILREQEKKRGELEKRMENIRRVRNAAASANREEKSKQREAEQIAAVQESLSRNERNLALMDTLEARHKARREEIAALSQEEERRKASVAFSGQGAWAAEEKHFEELLKGAERSTVHRQAAGQRAAAKYEEVKRTHKETVAKTTRRELGKKRSMYLQQNEELSRKQKELIAKEKSSILTKKAHFQQQREKHRLVKEKIVSLNPYAETIVQSSRARRTALSSSATPPTGIRQLASNGAY